MAQTKLYAPKGHHFMVNKKGGFYLMENPSTGYKFHKTSNGEKSALYVLVEVKKYHKTGVAARSTGATYTQLQDEVRIIPRNNSSTRTQTSSRSRSSSTRRVSSSRSTY